MKALIIISITATYRSGRISELKTKNVEYDSLDVLNKKTREFHTEVLQSDRSATVNSVCVVTE